MTTPSTTHSATDAPARPAVTAPPSTGNINPTTLPFFQGDFAYLDTETTGVDPQVDRIVEIAIVRYRDGKREIFHTLVDPEMPIPPTASAVHHITDRHIAEAKAKGLAPTFDKIADKVIDMLDGAHVYAHSAPFDEAFVDGALDIPLDPQSWTCTYRLSRHLFPEAPAHGNQVLRYWLQTNAESAGLGPHRAIDDVYVSLENTFHLWQRAAAQGFKTLDDLLELSNRPLLTTTLHFGKHAGKQFRDVPSSYFDWCLGPEGMKDMDSDLRISMEVELKRAGRKDDDARIKAEASASVIPSVVMLFGKVHYGKPMNQVPLEYLEWMESVDPKCSAEVRAGAALELNRRRQDAGSAHPARAPVSTRGADENSSDVAVQVYARLLALVRRGSLEESHLLSTRENASPDGALAAYLQDFANGQGNEFARVAELLGGKLGDWMREVVGMQGHRSHAPAPSRRPAMATATAAAPAPAPAQRSSATQAPSPQNRGPHDGTGRMALFNRRQAEPDADDAGPAPEMAPDEAPFPEAAPSRRMRPR